MCFSQGLMLMSRSTQYQRTSIKLPFVCMYHVSWIKHAPNKVKWQGQGQLKVKQHL